VVAEVAFHADYHDAGITEGGSGTDTAAGASDDHDGTLEVTGSH
jgi:hypothetical protein